MKEHKGYAGGATTHTLLSLIGAVRRLLSETETIEDPQKDGSRVVRMTHETDPPTNFVETLTVKLPGPLPELLGEVPAKARVLRHDYSAFEEAGQDQDVWHYHFARWVVTEARRLRARALVVESCERGAAAVVVGVAFVLP